ncbi:MAG: phosphoribosylglycinamide formyltransferase [Sphingomonadaceae bacterium]
MAERVRVAVLISGRGSNMAALLYAAKSADCPFQIVLVASNNPGAEGLVLAAAEGIAVFATSHIGSKRAEFDALIDAELRKADADYVALAGYMRLLSPDFVAKWRGRIVNIHPSLLPAHKGLHTHEAALAAGERVTGCTVHVVTEALDDGPVLGQTEVAVLSGDTADTLAARVLIAEHQLYGRCLAAYVTREFDAEWIISRVSEIALELPETSFRTSHGSPAWRVGSESSGKFFAIMFNRHHGEDSIGLLVKTSGQDEMAALIEADPEIYFRPAYYGPSGWIGIRLDRAGVEWDHVGDWLAKSWRLSAPKRIAQSAAVVDPVAANDFTFL